MNDLLIILFSKYSELLKHRFSEDFLEIVQTDDYMPMPINSYEEYDKVVSVSWYTPEKSREELTYVIQPVFVRVSILNCPVSHAFFHSLRCTPCAASTSETSSTKYTFSLMTTFRNRLLSTKPCEQYISLPAPFLYHD